LRWANKKLGLSGGKTVCKRIVLIRLQVAVGVIDTAPKDITEGWWYSFIDFCKVDLIGGFV